MRGYSSRSVVLTQTLNTKERKLKDAAQKLSSVLASAIGGAFLLLTPLYVLDAFYKTTNGDTLLNQLWNTVTGAWSLNVDAWVACAIVLAVLSAVGTVAAKAREIVGTVAALASNAANWAAETVKGSTKTEA